MARRQDVSEALERHRQREHHEQLPVRATSSASNAPPPRRIPIASLPTTISADRGEPRSPPDGEHVVAQDPGEAARSPAAATADSDGNTASENAAPMSTTGTLWKLRAKLTELTAPAPSRVATRVKNRKISGSTGGRPSWGHQAQELPERRVRTASWGRIRMSLRAIPTARTARWSTAPTTAPTAAAKMPIDRQSRTVPATMPAL